MRMMARAAAWLLPLAATACLTDPAAPLDVDAPTALQVVAQTSPSEGDRTVQVEVYFLNLQEERVDLPVSPAEIAVPANTQVTRGVTTQLAACFDEGYESDAGLYCPLRVNLVLLDDDGETIAEGSVNIDVLPGQNPVTVPSISLIPSSITGVVIDATTGNGLGGADVALYTGTNTETAPQATLVAGTGGAYLFPNLQPGTYTVVATSGGFFSATSDPIVVEAGRSTTHDIVVTPEVEVGQLRIVLTWGATPNDLDSYLFGPPAANNYHVYYASESAPPWAELDVDDTDSFGPETITILQQAVGTHIYSVHDFTNRLATTGNALATSGARVQVFGSNGPLAEFTVPNAPGTLWTVFSLNGETITPINLMTFVADPDLSPPPGIALGARHAAASSSRTPAARGAKAPKP